MYFYSILLLVLQHTINYLREERIRENYGVIRFSSATKRECTLISKAIIQPWENAIMHNLIQCRYLN